MNSLRAAIIGANSYIARNVIYCIKKDYQQIELSLYDIGDKQVDGSAHYESISILDREAVKRINMDCDLIFIFAGKTGSANGFDDCDTFIDVNEKGLLNVLNEYRSQHSKARIIFPSTRLTEK